MKFQTMQTIPALWLCCNLAFAQETYTVNNLADGFYGKIYLEQPSEVFSKGWIAIVDKKTGKELLKVESEELALVLHDGEALADIKELPYGEQSLIMYEDYNFDGQKDLAIEDGQNSCYHGPSFQIYLADRGKFAYNADFTRLAQEYCGMFEVDAVEKKLHTMTKSGCCWHQFSQFVIENNKPKAVNIIEEDASSSPPFVIHSEEKWDGRKMLKTSKKMLDLEENQDNVVFAFQVVNQDRQVVLLNTEGSMLLYALLKKNGEVEFSYPEDRQDQNAQFKFAATAAQRSLTFGNKTATYTVYENAANNKVGIKIDVGGKSYDWQGVENTKQGGLDFHKQGFGNMLVQ